MIEPYIKQEAIAILERVMDGYEPTSPNDLRELLDLLVFLVDLLETPEEPLDQLRGLVCIWASKQIARFNAAKLASEKPYRGFEAANDISHLR